MKLLLVSIPNHHFFQWTNQLKESGFEVYWFDITDGAGFVEKINWVKQFNCWKLKWNYPFRYRIKKQFPKLYSFLEKITVNRVEVVFENVLNEIQPDIVHCFEMKLSGLPILSIMQQNKIPFVYSSWGSDMYAYQNLGVSTDNVKSFLNRVNYLITDCNRDFQIAQQLGFTNQFLGFFPGNGGIETESAFMQPISNRKTICVKGYDDGVGKALVVIKAIELIQFDSSIDFLIFSADEIVEEYLKKSAYFKQTKVEMIPRKSFMTNKLLLQKLGSCLLYIGNSTSDGMPNSLLEAMGMGAFPIQSNPGKVTEEIITHGVNGFLIENPNEVVAIASLIKTAIENQQLRAKAQEYNVSFVQENYNREMLRNKIINLYQSVNLS
ncbi:glycosyltransferase [Flavobacterium undicola]|uniref:glycosyltransferase n=1 Tax=Flavobacterium undicola TaxID=1932779 RepID=UPI001377D1E8|nr:glycosyltransferase [Flavobacterium undicola]MBA0884748.1 glycosyltransferase [Flavobacterium undicola]